MNTAAASTLAAPWPATRLATDEPVQPMALPSAESGLRYAWRYWSARMASVSSPHRLRPHCGAHYSAPFELTASLRERWADLFDERRGPSGVTYPFLCAQSVITLLHSRIFADLGVNVSHVLHLRQGMRLASGVDAGSLSACGGQTVDSALARVVRIGPTEVLVIVNTRIADARGAWVADIEDSFVVRRLEVAYAVQAEEDDAVRRAVSRLRRRGPDIDPLAPGVRARQLYLAPSVTRRFGRVAGERQSTPLLPLPPRLFGLRRPVVQRAYLRNLVVRELSEWGLDLRELQIVFAARARIGQTLRLMEFGGRFELFDEAGRLVAYGRASGAATSAPAAS